MYLVAILFVFYRRLLRIPAVGPAFCHFLLHARRSQQSLTLGLRFNQGKEGVSLPVGLIVYELLSGLSAATALAADAVIRGMTVSAQIMTVINWRTYPFVYFDDSESCVPLGRACMYNATP